MFESEGECFNALEVVYYCGGESVQECEGNTKVLKKSYLSQNQIKINKGCVLRKWT